MEPLPITKRRTFADADLYDPSVIPVLEDLDDLEDYSLSRDPLDFLIEAHVDVSADSPFSSSTSSSSITPLPFSRSGDAARPKTFPTSPPPIRDSAASAPPPVAPRSRRHMIVKEILKTEESYVSTIQVLQEYFLDVMCKTEGMPTSNAHLTERFSTSTSNLTSSSSGPPPIKHRFHSFFVLYSSGILFLYFILFYFYILFYFIF